jgi:mRNA interferase HigB
MKVVGKRTLGDFKRRHADARSHVNAWLCEVEEAEWRSSHDIKARYATASFLADNRVVFNLKGHTYRVDVKVSYVTKVVFVKRIGTHTEYDNWKF